LISPTATQHEPAHEQAPRAAAPLAGVRVLELARILAGPWAGQLLADLGADVVKVERPGSGDDTRAWGPPFVPAADGGDLSAAYFHAANRGKRSIAIDMETADGQALIRRLAVRADVVIENFKVGGLARYGLDHAALSALNPRLITCSITGFGQTGPYASRPGYDFVVQAMGGFMHITGDAEGEPQKAGLATADLFTGVYAAVAILAALRRRDETGLGAHLDMALLDVQTGVLANQAMNYFVSGRSPRRMGNAHPNLVPYQVFPTNDGYMVVATGNDAQFIRFAGILGAGDLAADPRYADNAGRVANRHLLVPALTALTMRFTMADLLAALERAGVPAGPINDLHGVFTDPHIAARGMVHHIAEPRAAGGTIPGLRSPILIDGLPMMAALASPALDGDRASILQELVESERK
jgi:crotonobetainyl-CoA:carnitine CoA-transferase CaiB-like acyl-CoA transferase